MTFKATHELMVGRSFKLVVGTLARLEVGIAEPLLVNRLEDFALIVYLILEPFLCTLHFQTSCLVGWTPYMEQGLFMSFKIYWATVNMKKQLL